jgi:hypothetical protein
VCLEPHRNGCTPTITYDDAVPSSTTANEALGRLDPERRRWIEEFRDGVRALLGERLRDLRL